MNNYKTYTAFVLLAFSANVFAQVSVGGKQSVSSNAVSLEFEAGNRGIIVPWVTGTNTVDNTANTALNTPTGSGAVSGTVVYDTTDKSMKVKTSTGWKDLSVDKTGVVNTTLQDGLNDQPNAKTSIGAPTNTPGILVLEATNKAMILPKVASPHLKIVKPEPGMMVYDTDSKQLAVFNGTVWTFWKP